MIVTVAAALVGASALAVSAGDGEPGEIRWERDLEAARARAAREGKPLFVVFRCET